MTQMVRKQIYIDKRHNLLLKRLARARQVSEAEVIRQALDREALALTRAPGVGRPDSGAWELVQRAMEARRGLGRQGAPYRWKRDDAYAERDEQFDRLSQPAKGP
jgi:hypothetical protein